MYLSYNALSFLLLFFTLPSLKSIFCCVCCCCFACNGYLIQCNVRIKQIVPSMEQAFAQTRLILLLLTRIAPNTAIYVPALVVDHLVSFFKLLLFVTAVFKTNISLNDYKEFLTLCILLLIVILNDNII